MIYSLKQGVCDPGQEPADGSQVDSHSVGLRPESLVYDFLKTDLFLDLTKRPSLLREQVG